METAVISYRVADFLKTHAPFHGVAEDDLLALASGGRVRFYEPNEYILWQTTPYFNTYKGRWRVVGQSNTNYWDINDAPFSIFYGEYAISQVYGGAPLVYIKWRGAWDETYQVQYSTNLTNTTGMVWVNATNGTGPNQIANFVATNGGDFLYEDIGSGATNSRFRAYRILWEQY